MRLFVLWLLGSVPVALLAGRILAAFSSSEKPRRGLYLSPLAVVLVLLLAACGGAGRDAGIAAVVSSVGAGGCEGGAANGCTAPASDPEPTCAGQGYTGTFPNCVCPEPYQVYTGASTTNHVAGTCVGNPPPLTCPAGQSLTGYGAQCCPTGDTGDGSSCFAPPPAPCPSGDYGTPPNCIPIPSCSAVVGGFWGGSACECPAASPGTYPNCIAPCPAGDTGTPPNCVAPVTCDAVPGAYFGGTACECPAGDVGAYPSCFTQSSITLTVVANIDPGTVIDTTGTATLSWSVTSSVSHDTFLCVVNDEGAPTLATSTTVGPFTATQDNSAVSYSVTCTDEWNVSATSAPVSVTIVAPPAPPQDQFTCAANGDGSYSCSWYTYEPGAECYVIEYSSSGPEATGVQLNPGGGSSGAAGSVGNINAIYGPWSFTLSCNTGTTASPNPITVSP